MPTVQNLCMSQSRTNGSPAATTHTPFNRSPQPQNFYFSDPTAVGRSIAVSQPSG